MLAIYGLDGVYSKSSLHNCAKKLGAEVDRVVTLMRMQAEKNGDADGPLDGDASGFSQMRYEDRGDAKKKIASRRMFDNLHILMAPYGMMVMCEAAPGGAHDSPVFRRMFECIPKGGGHVRPDAAYPARENCEMIERSGRIPVIRSIKPQRKGIWRHGQDAQMARGGSGRLQEGIPPGEPRGERAFSVIREGYAGRSPAQGAQACESCSWPSSASAATSRHNRGNASAICGAQRMPQYSDRRYCG